MQNFAPRYLLPIVLFLRILNFTLGQELVSPCPKVLTYEARNAAEPDKWFGNINLQSDSDLRGIWLRVVFDKTTIQLGNWFGEVATEDNISYLVKNRNFNLAANKPYNLRFYLKYAPVAGQPPPKIAEIRLNAKTICPIGGPTTTAPVVTGEFTSGPRSTEATFQQPARPISMAPKIDLTPVNVRPQVPSQLPNPTSGSDDDDYFHGDFSPFSRPSGPTNELEVQCGTVVIPPKPLITYGQATREGEFPWHAALYLARGIDLSYICGASLISKTHLITVAHCVTKRQSQKALNPANLLVYLGKYYLKSWSNTGIQDSHIERIIVHQDYNPQAFHNDIAILKLSKRVDITNYVRPVCLWSENVDLNSVIGKQGTVVGWGFDETGKVTEELRQNNMPIVSQETCIYSFPDFFSRFTSKETFCAGFLNGSSVCNGDSGGGMVFPKAGTPSRAPVWHLRGLISVSVALQNTFKCDSFHYVVFTDVAKYLGWIKAALI